MLVQYPRAVAVRFCVAAHPRIFCGDFASVLPKPAGILTKVKDVAELLDAMCKSRFTPAGSTSTVLPHSI